MLRKVPLPDELAVVSASAWTSCQDVAAVAGRDPRQSIGRPLPREVACLRMAAGGPADVAGRRCQNPRT